MSERITDERIVELIVSHELAAKEGHYWDGPSLPGESRDTAAALRELQQWRSGVHPQTGAPIGSFELLEPWNDETE